MNTSKNLKLFGYSGITGSIAQFGSIKSGLPIYSSDPDIIQALDAFSLNGWSDALVGGSKATMQDINVLLYLMSYQLRYLNQAGIPEWNSETEYFIGSFVSDTTGTIYVSIADNNINNALTVNTKWLNLVSRNVTAITVSTGTYYYVKNDDYIIDWSAALNIGSVDYLYLPNSAYNAGRKLIIKSTNMSVDGHISIYKDPDETGVIYITQQDNIYDPGYGRNYWDLGRGEILFFYCSGTDWFGSRMRNTQ